MPETFISAGSDQASSVFYVVEYPRARPSKRRQREQWSRIGARPANSTLPRPRTTEQRSSEHANAQENKIVGEVAAECMAMTGGCGMTAGAGAAGR